MARFLLYAIPVVITIYALIDAIMTPGRQARTLPKALWVVLIVVLPFAGAIAWLLLGRPRSEPYDRGNGRGGGGGGGGTPSAPRLPGLPGRKRGPAAPDDDPAFLRELDDAAWEAKMRERRAGNEDSSA